MSFPSLAAAALMAAVGLSATVAAPAGAALRPGDLDSGFGSAGTVLLDPALAAPKSSFVTDVALDAQGRVLVTGGGRDQAGHQAVFVQRLLTDGSVDASFGDGGLFVRQVGLGGTDDRPQSTGTFVAPAPDGKILVGVARNVGDTSIFDAAALRLNAQGRLDLDYGSSGVTETARLNPGQLTYATASSAVVGPDGSLVLVGTLYSASTTDPTYAALIGFGPTGQPLAAFRGGATPGVGWISGDYSDLAGSARRTQAYSILGLPSGSYLVGGSTARRDGDRAFIARRTPDGYNDTSYGTNGNGGVVFTSFSPASTDALAAGPAGSVYAGFSHRASVDTVFITRYGASGQVDPGFAGGLKSLQFAQCVADQFSCGTSVTDLRVDGAGRLLVLMTLRDGNRGERFAVARLRSDGAFDTAFGVDGVAYGPAPTATSSLRFGAMALQGDDHVVLGGTRDAAQSQAAAVARMAVEPIADPPVIPDPPASPIPLPPALGGGPPAGGPGLSPPPAADRAAPAVSKAKVTVSRTRRAAVTLQSSEAGTLTVKLLRPRDGRRGKGRCSPTARRGARCTVFVATRTLTRPLAPGTNTAALGSAPLAAGRYRVTIAAADAAGNRARAITIGFQVRSARRR